jgi:hypothetical protein
MLSPPFAKCSVPFLISVIAGVPVEFNIDSIASDVPVCPFTKALNVWEICNPNSIHSHALSTLLFEENVFIVAGYFIYDNHPVLRPHVTSAVGKHS